MKYWSDPESCKTLAAIDCIKATQDYEFIIDRLLGRIEGLERTTSG
jgi:hypothetical protein